MLIGNTAEITCQPGCVQTMLLSVTMSDVWWTGEILFVRRNGVSFSASARQSMFCCWSKGMIGRGASFLRRRFQRYSIR